MSESEKDTKALDADLNNVEGSTGASELYIDPIKEAKMMRKFDVCEACHVLRELLIRAADLLYRYDGPVLSNGKFGPVCLADEFSLYRADSEDNSGAT